MARKSTNRQRASAPNGAALRPRGALVLVAKTLLPVVMIGIAVMAFVALASTKPETRPRKIPEKAWSVRTVAVNITDHRPKLKLYGETVAGRRLEMRSLVTGEITQTSDSFREGGVVAKGDVLLKLDPFDFQASLAEARANLAEAEAKLSEIKARVDLETGQITASRGELQLAVRDLDRARDLFKQKLVSQKSVDDRQYTMSQRKQALSQRISALAIEKAKAAQQEAALLRLRSLLRRAQRDLKDTKLVAPFNAYISAVNAEQGRMVSPNDRVATLIDIDRIDVRFNFSDAQFGRVVGDGKTVIGRPIDIIWRVGATALSYSARIERVAAQITAATGGVEIYARVGNPRQTVPLRPGAFVEVIIDDKTFEKVARLPETALYNNSTVFVVNGGGRLEARSVKLLGYAGNDILVRGALKPGDKVVTTRLSQAKDGLLVDVK